MRHHLTTAQLAAALAVAPSTIRHYRAVGRIAQVSQTPGGHARWDLADVRRALGYTGTERGSITGLKVDTFAPPCQHDISGDGPTGPLPMEMIALNFREDTMPWRCSCLDV